MALDWRVNTKHYYDNEDDPPAIRRVYSNVQSQIPDFHIDEQSKGVLKEILQSKDRDDKGYVNMDELGDCLEAFGFSPDDDDLQFLKKHMDDNGDGKLEVQEILDNIEVINYHCWYGKELMHEFKCIDNDKDGVIRFPEMLRYLTLHPVTPMEPVPAGRLLDRLARKFDTNFDGKFSYPEFVMIYMSDMLPFKTDIENGTFTPSQTDDSKPKTGVKTKKKLIRKKTADSSEASTNAATAAGRVDAANDNIRNWRAHTAHKDSTSRTSGAATSVTSSRPKTGSKHKTDHLRPKTGQRPKTGGGSGVGSKVSSGTSTSSSSTRKT